MSIESILRTNLVPHTPFCLRGAGDAISRHILASHDVSRNFRLCSDWRVVVVGGSPASCRRLNSTATRNLLGSTYSVYLSVITYLTILLLHTVLGPDVYEKYEGNKLFVFYASRASPFYKCIIIFSWKDALCLFKAAKTSMSRLWQHHSIPFRRSYFIRHIIIYSPIFDQPVAGCRSVAVDFSCILQ